MGNDMARVVRQLTAAYAGTLEVNSQNEVTGLARSRCPACHVSFKAFVTCVQERLTPLMMGLTNSHVEATTALLQSAFLKLDVADIQNADGLTAMQIAEKNKDTDRKENIWRAMKKAYAWQWLKRVVEGNGGIGGDIKYVYPQRVLANRL